MHRFLLPGPEPLASPPLPCRKASWGFPRLRQFNNYPQNQEIKLQLVNQTNGKSFFLRSNRRPPLNGSGLRCGHRCPALGPVGREGDGWQSIFRGEVCWCIVLQRRSRCRLGARVTLTVQATAVTSFNIVPCVDLSVTLDRLQRQRWWKSAPCSLHSYHCFVYFSFYCCYCCCPPPPPPSPPPRKGSCHHTCVHLFCLFFLSSMCLLCVWVCWQADAHWWCCTCFLCCCFFAIQSQWHLTKHQCLQYYDRSANLNGNLCPLH